VTVISDVGNNLQLVQTVKVFKQKSTKIFENFIEKNTKVFLENFIKKNTKISNFLRLCKNGTNGGKLQR